MNACQWYTLRVRGGQEEKIKLAILEAVKKKGLEAYLGDLKVPYEKVTVTKKGKKEIRKRYVAYMFVHVNLSNGKIREVIMDVQGVLGFLGSRGWGGKEEPIPLQQREIDRMLSNIEEKKNVAPEKSILEKGQSVTIIDQESSLCGFSGEVLEVSKNGKAIQISINVFGGNHQATINLRSGQVEVLSKSK